MRPNGSPRRGAYAAIFGVTAFAFVAFGAIAVDLSLIRLADAELQAVADAAAHAAILQLRRTGDEGVAKATAQEVVDANLVAGTQPAATQVAVGIYENSKFIESSFQPSAVSVNVQVTLETPFGSFWGDPLHKLNAMATAAVRPLHAVVSLDITNSWGNAFSGARDGTLEIFDQLTAAATEADHIGLATFHNKYGVEYTPLQRTINAPANGVRDDWLKLTTAFETDKHCVADGEDDALAGYTASEALPANCYSAVPYELSDEHGTDHAIGMQMAVTMFKELPDPSVYRALIIVTDGQPAGVGEAERRDEVGFVDDRWRYYFAEGEGRKGDEVSDATIKMAENLWADDEVHVWLVSYRQNSSWLYDVPQGDGYFVLAQNAKDLDDIFRDIAESLPVTLVE